MSDPDDESTEPSAEGAASAPSGKGKRRAMSNVGLEIKESDLSNPIVAKFLADELEDLRGELGDARKIIAESHSTNIKVAVLEERLNTKRAVEILSTGAVATGSILIGLAGGNLLSDSSTSRSVDVVAEPLILPASTDSGLVWIILSLGVILLICGVAAKAIKS
ncbi:hypothetical protein LGQ03_15120 [Loktanella sp. TSTF-M6]|uniref:DUF3618 domain-containing protein n=1 Tax=Loktanella gaetbuli TaxID=2881335 RepID=A0ABS8BYQ8_9RHOB|nr:hypothetical protein [Loktanella gaetbuli]MCB5200571.1 hypothetical protein [Loktanella gaetbuli]